MYNTYEDHEYYWTEEVVTDDLKYYHLFETNNQFAGYRDKDEALIASVLYYEGYFKPYYVMFTDYKIQKVNGPRRTAKNFDTLEEAKKYIDKVLEIDTELNF
jgi:hypothetical protein